MNIHKDEFVKFAKQYQKIKASHELQVIRWEWATGQIYSHQPFYFEQNPRSKGKKLLRDPLIPKDGIHEIGIDKNNLLVVERVYTDLPGKFYEEFYNYSTNMLELIRFEYFPEKPVESISRWYFKDKRLLNSEEMTLFAEVTKEYNYKNDKLISINRWVKNAYYPKGSRSTTKIIYDDAGIMCRLLWSGQRVDGEKIKDSIIYETRKNTYSSRQLYDVIKSKLIAIIPKWVKAVSKIEKYYCVALVYSEENDFLPPSLWLGDEAHRKDIINKYGLKAGDHFWRQSGKCWQWPPPKLEDIELSEACRLLNQELAKKMNWSFAKKLLNEVSYDLMQINWKEFLDITDDFIVYACDLEMADIKKNIKASIGIQRFNEFKSRVLI